MEQEIKQQLSQMQRNLALAAMNSNLLSAEGIKAYNESKENILGQTLYNILYIINKYNP